MGKENGKPELITRREAIFRVSAMLGGVALVGQTAMLSGCATQGTGRSGGGAANDLFLQSDIELLDEVADTMLPETSTPGAKAAAVGPFIALMVTDTYYPDDQQIFLDGVKDLQTRCLVNFGAHFQVVTAAQRLQMLEMLDLEQWTYMNEKADGAPTHYFRMMKELALLGYFTSEIGYTQAMRYRETPGSYDPCAPYTEGEAQWAPHA